MEGSQNVAVASSIVHWGRRTAEQASHRRALGQSESRETAAAGSQNAGAASTAQASYQRALGQSESRKSAEDGAVVAAALAESSVAADGAASVQH